MSVPLRIDFVSDVSCPWCIIGLKSLETALDRLRGAVAADLHFQPFELNPGMPQEGQDIVEHITQKYGFSPAQVAANRENIRARGAELGFTFRMEQRDRIYNTFDAHRLLHWAGLEVRQAALKHALFRAYFAEGKNPSDHDTLVQLAEQAGLDGVKARAVLDSDAYAADVRTQERFYQERGIQAVPAIIINDRHLISGGQPPKLFEQALRQLAQQT